MPRKAATPGKSLTTESTLGDINKSHKVVRFVSVVLQFCVPVEGEITICALE